MPDAHDPYAALRSPDYRCFLTGAVLASIGGEIQAVAVGWELFLRTRSEIILGLTGLVQFLPVLLLALPAGQAADIFSRRLLFQLAQMTQVLASLGLWWLSITEGPVSLTLACLTVSGIARAISGPARSALLYQVVPLEALPNAVTWNSSGWQLANVAGPALGGLLVGWTGRAATAYLVACACALACIGLLIPVRPREVPRLRTARSLAGLLDGARFVLGTELLLAAITLDLFAVLLGGATALLPVFAENILQVGPAGLGWLRAAPALGALMMAVLMAHRRPLERPGRAILLAVAGFGAATIAFGFSRSFSLSFILLSLTGALDNVSVVVRGTLMQLLTPDAMRGRVAAVNSVFISSSNELGAFESGTAAHLFGAVPAVVGGGIGTIWIVLGVMYLWPRLLALGPLHQLRPAQEEPTSPGAS